MSTTYQILPVEKPTDEMWEVIGGGINHYELKDFPPGQTRYYMTKDL